MATLILAGLRVSELAVLHWDDVDLTKRKLYVRDAKTEAGVRPVPISKFLQADLLTYKMYAVKSELVFPTGTGNGRDKDNIRNRIHNPVIKRANANLKRDGRPTIPLPLTPHALRRTFISLLLVAGEDVRSVMAWAGHSTPNITLAIYAQVFTNPDSREVAQRLLWKPGEANGSSPT